MLSRGPAPTGCGSTTHTDDPRGLGSQTPGPTCRMSPSMARRGGEMEKGRGCPLRDAGGKGPRDGSQDLGAGVLHVCSVRDSSPSCKLALCSTRVLKRASEIASTSSGWLDTRITPGTGSRVGGAPRKHQLLPPGGGLGSPRSSRRHPTRWAGPGVGRGARGRGAASDSEHPPCGPLARIKGKTSMQVPRPCSSQEGQRGPAAPR